MSDQFEEENVTGEELATETASESLAPAAAPTRKGKSAEEKAAEAAAKAAAKEAKAAEKEAAKAAKAAAKAAAKEAKAAEKALNKKPKEPRGITAGARAYKLEDTITLLVEENPKRGASAERFAKYASGQTVAQALEAGVLRADIVWDAGRGFIEVVPAAAA